MKKHRLHLISGVTLLWFLATGCAHLGTRLEKQTLPEGAPEIQTILADLSANDAAINTFRAAGSFWLESPNLSAKKKFETGSIAFRRPSDLAVTGRNQVGMALFRLTCVGEEFLIEFPASKDEPYYQLKGETFASVPFSVSPSDIAKEMFLPESWNTLKLREINITSYDPATQTATFTIGPKRAPRRIVTVQGVPWVVTRDERLNNEGLTIAITVKDKYFTLEGVRFPEFIDAEFPTEQTRLTFDMRNIKLNVPIEDDKFDIKARAREVGINLNNGDQTNSRKKTPKK